MDSVFRCRGVDPALQQKRIQRSLVSDPTQAPAHDVPGLFIGPSTNPELAQIARQTASRACFKKRVNRTEPHGSVSWASMIKYLPAALMRASDGRLSKVS